MRNKQIVGLVVAIVVIVVSIMYLQMGKAKPVISGAPAAEVTAAEASPSLMPADSAARIAAKSAMYEKAKEIAAPSGFVNTDGQPITISQYVGKKVVLLDIMTYSCINCIRTFPYLVDWYKKYEDKGLVIIGIHTPEFDFEKNIDNVTAAMKKYGITFPVVLDNDYGTWSAYKNLYWPRKYLIDIDGFIRYDHIGEGGYGETEEKIQDLLKERADVLGLGAAVSSSIDMPTMPEAVSQAPESLDQSRETYFGSARNEFFGNGAPGRTTGGMFTIPDKPTLNRFYLGGEWSILPDHAENTAVPAKIVYPFVARKVFFVASADSPVAVNVSVDGKALAPITVHEARLYDVYATDALGQHTLELSPQGKGLQAFTLTFGN